MDNKTPILIKKVPPTARAKHHKAVKPEGTLLYPESAEREYSSIALKHVRLYGEVLKDNLPEILNILRETREDSADYHADSRILNFSERFSKTIRKMEKELSEKLEDFQTDVFIKKVAKRANTNNARQWIKLVKKTFGVDLDGHYYNRGTWADLIDRWTEQNVGFVRSLPQESLSSMRRIVEDGYFEGWGITKIRNEIVREFGLSKSKAKALAVDQMGTLCSQITRKQQTDAGCTHYRWKSRKDSKVRESHRQYNGKIFSWDDPPPSWYMTKSRGKVFTGRMCHPGEDYCCRCMAIPVFDKETLNLPVDESGERRIRSETANEQSQGIPQTSLRKTDGTSRRGRR